MKVYKCRKCGGWHTVDYCPDSDDPLCLNEQAQYVFEAKDILED